MSKKFLLIALLLLVASPLVFSQVRTGNISGTVTDQDGGPLPGVSVSITGGRIAKLSAVTSDGGNYRFLSLPPADDFKLVFELAGFKTTVRENISIRVGADVDLKVALEAGAVEEEITVVAQQPIVDMKKSTVQANVTRESLQNLPSARDPWVVLELAPGVLIDRENIGGSESGQQSNFAGRGDSGNNAQWNLDGVNISDPAAVGASPMYWDFDMFEEMNIQTAANDVTAVTGGVNINFVTPRGGNRFSGGGRFYITNDAFQSNNTPPDVLAEDLAGNRVDNINDYGFNLGGPLVKDKLWFWGSYGVQNIRQVNITGAPINTDLVTINFKLNAQLGAHRIEAYGVSNTKKMYGRRRTGGYLDDPAATYNQLGPGKLIKLQDEITVSQNFFMSLKGSYVSNEFELMPQGGIDAVMYWDRAVDRRWGTGDYYLTHRPMWYAEAMGNLYVEDLLGANHEFKFGAEYKTAKIDSETTWGNGVQARLMNGEGYQVRFYNDIFEKFYANRVSAYLQDVMSFGRFTLNAGLRYDRQWGGILEATNRATNVALMSNIGGVDYNWPAATQSAADFPFTWNMFSPRVGLIVDLFGNRKTLFKANFSIYGSQFDASPAWNVLYLWGYHRFAWADNGDQVVQANELTYQTTSETVSLAPDTDELIGDYFDTNVSPEKTMELLAGFEHEINNDFGVGVNVQYRKMYDFNWQKFLVYDYLNDSAVRQVQDDDWIEIGTIGATTYWDLDPERVGYTFTNYMTKRPDYYETYLAAEFTFNKRLSHRWMLDGSFTWQDHKVFYPTRQSYLDPTNHLPVDMLDGRPMAYQAAGSGSSDVYMNARWMAKLGGLYQFPLGINFSATLSARDGFISPTFGEDYDYTNYNGDTPQAWTEPFGDTRDPAVFLFNARLEKKFDLRNFGSFYISADGFNIFNSNVQMARNRNLSAENYGQTLCIMSPRIFRFGLRFQF